MNRWRSEYAYQYFADNKKIPDLLISWSQVSITLITILAMGSSAWLIGRLGDWCGYHEE